MADHTFTLTAAEENILTQVSAYTGVSKDQLIAAYAVRPLKNQVVQYLKEQAMQKAAEATPSEQIEYLELISSTIKKG